ncbi:ATP-dependent DNA helicase [Caballeronia zhejiangensis]|uniref:ATP-dependent DNA helicase n=1 Tax=Caballeronia zhejiangensis TaxID=871203 RepID=UPI001EF6B07A|nr:ATP-dependent RecD-like DNA helicase [Caballeronia zhejiangensis]MCG7399681.1 AAA family ATPase [Caballeronia zhejiangensis]
MAFVNHISIRVPWHDDQWRGTVCRRPRDNGACLVLPEIADAKRDDAEVCVAGRRFDEIKESELPPCLKERASFMAPFTLRRKLTHPYKYSDSAAHNDLQTMELQQPPFSAACIPFKWMRREFADDIAKGWRLDYDLAREPTEPSWLTEGGWVQNGRNQRAMLDGFFSTIKKDHSLCFFYAKQTPFSDDPRRVLIAVGRIEDVGKPIQYEREEKLAEPDTSYVWDVVVRHSIRAQVGEGGFLMPYAELAAAQEQGADVDWSRCLAFSPADRLSEFSYAAEHVTHDGAISALLECRLALEAAKEVLPQVDGVAQALRWIDARISELWNLRGPYPGLGAALSAFGVPHGNFLALHLADHLNENDDPWPLVDKVMCKPASLPTTLAKLVTRDLTDQWKALKSSRLELLKLLARFALTNEQATRFYVRAEREAAGLHYDDSQLLENPYLIYESDRFSVPMSDEGKLERVNLETIDRGAYPADVVAEKHPLPDQSRMSGPRDKRRVRALVIGQLEDAARSGGHTMLPEDLVILGIRNAKLEPPCAVSEDVIDATAEFFPYEVSRVALKGGMPALQLQRYVAFRKLLSSQIHLRVRQGARFVYPDDWRARLDKLLPALDETDKDEVRARQEKAAALAELAASRFSVLVGPAGAGKTTVLRALCQHEQIGEMGVLLLAPTGKARVQLSQKCGRDAQTLAQFLAGCGERYDGRTGVYKTVPGAPYKGCKTVIVDEASMLTEDMLGALFDAVKGSVDRLILVGDPRQLPPIGAGKPFFDAVTYLTYEEPDTAFPRVRRGYAELTIQRRHKQSGEQDSYPVDLQLANWFSGRPLAPGEDEIWSILGRGGDTTGRVATHRWDTTEELRTKLLEVLRIELDLQSLEDQQTFATSYGGVRGDQTVGFKLGAASEVEAWQVLTPLRNDVLGAKDINRLLHKTFRKDAVAWARKRSDKRGRIPPPRGQEDIVYGDKVINVRNHTRKYVTPEARALEYIANGEIGVVVGDLLKAGVSGKAPWLTKVEFSSQPGFVYNFAPWDFDEERSPLLELAYAVTVHKAQGSEFGTTILVLPQKSRLITREMLYTALTRQQRRVVILHQGDLSEFQKLATDENAVIPGRFTNLFEKENPAMLPAPVEVNGKWMDEKLIHRSRRGTALRSKSEVIIDDALAAHGVIAGYEVPFFSRDGLYHRLPDFTIEDQAIGRTILWEHCGMLSDEGYRDRWENKLRWYRENGVLPLEEGGGDRATLVVTHDDERGGIDGRKIDELIGELFG